MPIEVRVLIRAYQQHFDSLTDAEKRLMALREPFLQIEAQMPPARAVRATYARKYIVSAGDICCVWTSVDSLIP